MLQYLHTDFEFWFEKAIGVDLGITVDTEVTPAISIGDTVWLENAGLATYAEQRVADDGYFIKRVGNTIFIDGITERGTLYGAYGFLEKYLGYNFVNYENDRTNYTLDIETASSFSIDNVYDVEITPYLAGRHYMQNATMYGDTNQKTMMYQHNNGSMAIYQTGYGGLNFIARLTGELNSDGTVVSDISTGNIYHSMHETYVVGVKKYNHDNGTAISESDYATLKEIPAAALSYYQPCFSSGVTKDLDKAVNATTLCAYALKALIEQQYGNGARMFSFSVNDTDATAGYLPYCNCSDCQSALGTDENLKAQRSTVMIINFINAVITEIEKDTVFMQSYPDFKIYTLAYAFSNTCPTEFDVKFDERVCLHVCAQNMSDYLKPITDAENSFVKDNILAWKEKLSDKSEMFILQYNGYGNLPIYWPMMTTVILDNVKWYHDIGVKALDIEGKWVGYNYWEDKLYGYIYSRIMYEFDEIKYANDKNAYLNELVDDYLKAYYGDSWEAVKDLLWTYQGYYNTIYSEENKQLTLDGNVKISEQLSLKQLEFLESIIDAEINIQTDSTIQMRLKEIKLSIQASVIFNYKGYYPLDLFANGFDDYAEEFKALCAEVGVTVWSTNYPIDQYIALLRKDMYW